MSEELKPCPFCGEKERLMYFGPEDRYRSIVCCRCGAEIRSGTHSDAIAVWNRRTADARVERMEKVVAGVLKHWDDTEARSSEAHDTYQKEAHSRGDVRHADAYEDLSEPTKEWDRVLVRWVAASLRAALSPEKAKSEGGLP